MIEAVSSEIRTKAPAQTRPVYSAFYRRWKWGMSSTDDLFFSEVSAPDATQPHPMADFVATAPCVVDLYNSIDAMEQTFRDDKLPTRYMDTPCQQINVSREKEDIKVQLDYPHFVLQLNNGYEQHIFVFEGQPSAALVAAVQNFRGSLHQLTQLRLAVNTGYDRVKELIYEPEF